MSEFPDLMDFVISQFGAVVFYPYETVAMPFCVFPIFNWGSPRKVGQTAFCTDSIQMATMVTERAWTYKGFQNKDMNMLFIMGTISSQGYIWVAQMKRWFEGSLGAIVQDTHSPLVFAQPFTPPIRSHAPLVRNIISRIFRNWFPNLTMNVKLGITHCADLLLGWCVGESRAGVVAPCPARSFIAQAG